MPGLPKIYKRYQGQYTRSITAVSLVAIVVAMCYFLFTMLDKYVKTDDVAELTMQNATASWALAEDWPDERTLAAWASKDPWPDEENPRYQRGTVISDDVRANLIKGGPERWMFIAAHPVPYALYIHYGVPALVFAISCWLIFRLVNGQRFADFLIATESEMKKVSWSSKAELIGSTIVVIVTVFILAVLIYIADFIWTFGFVKIGVLPGH